MLTVTVAHTGQNLAPHDLWGAWNADPVMFIGLLVAAAVYRRGYHRGRDRPAHRWRARCFVAGLAVLTVALMSPLDSLGSALASAHMAQHLLLVLVAAPLLALSAPTGVLLAGSPAAVRPAIGSLRRRANVAVRAARRTAHPLFSWLLHVAALWIWHAAVLYDAALEQSVVHAAQHAAFLLTALMFWRAVVGPGKTVPPGLGIALVFTMALQSTFLSLLLTFSSTPWYRGYAETTSAWGLAALADQQLAGVIMWVPAGLLYLAVALALLLRWLPDEADRPLPAVPPVP